ncbi:MAG: preprotein translocase subunit SecG [Rhodospirillales bacterium]|jgi:preprotein translocase subunit SecG|nr:preprotein translocase subunit SecG [Rhodospirillales bacterium]MDP7651166.1 preprotein translocase subunit SecG [Rhodospirillales bacterium]HJO97724.1 preprotein translocase subunit SecG [Rhodospirillales bacterium]
MTTVVLVIHLLLAIALVGTILIQRSEGGGLGMGGGGGGMGGLMTGRAAANMLTRITGGLAAGFIATSLILAIMAGGGRAKQGSIVDRPSPVEQPAKPAGPAVPLAK